MTKNPNMQKPSKYNLLTTLNDVNRAQVRDQLALQKVALKRVLKELTLLLRSENPVNLIPLHPSTLQTRRQIFIINSKFSLTASRRWILTGLPVGFFTFFGLLGNTWIIFMNARPIRVKKDNILQYKSLYVWNKIWCVVVWCGMMCFYSVMQD